MFELELFEISRIDTLRLIHSSTCLIGAIIMISTWLDTKKISNDSDNNWGLLYISIALMLWAAMDIYRLLGLMKPGEVSVILKIFSVYNNAFLLASLPFFEEVFINVKKRFTFYANQNTWALVVFVANVFIATFYSLTWGEQSNYSHLVKNFDAIYSFLTMLGIGIAVIVSLQKKGLKFMKWLAIFICTLLTVPQIFFSTLFSVGHFDIISLILLISQICLIYLLIILAMLWRSDIISNLNFIKLNFLEQESLQLKKLNENILIENRSLQESMGRMLTDIAISKNELSNLKTQKIQDDLFNKLSDRELDVMKIINKSYLEIGQELFISKETVITHKKNIESKLRISGKENLEKYARESGLLSI